MFLIFAPNREDAIQKKYLMEGFEDFHSWIIKFHGCTFSIGLLNVL